ncbi:MAG: hypothetical protein GC145_14855 [Caulobacter sp.]|nr:hypothetical protein [Caulobacter sp.]
MSTVDRARLNFADGGLLTAADFAREQAFHIQTQALRCRSLHNWGVAFGLEIAVAPGGLGVTVSPGMAINAAGQEIRLTQTALVDLSSQVAPAVYLGVATQPEDQDWRIYPLGSGYVRIADRATMIISPEAPRETGAVVPLARLTFTPARRVETPDLSTRRVCGLNLGQLLMRPPDDAGPTPTLAMDATGQALAITSPLTDLFGSLAVSGAVRVGPATASDTALLVKAGKPVPGAGLISSDGPVLFGADAYDLASLTPGDQILVPLSPDIDLKDAAQTLQVQAVSSQTVTVATAPVNRLYRSDYAISHGAVAKIRINALTTALTVSAQGGVAIGGDLGPALLTIRNGDVLMGDQNSLRFMSDGSVQADGNAANQIHAIHFWASQNTLEVREAGQILFETSGAASDVPDLMLASNQNVGVGVSDPGNRLTVDGVISASGGVIFADNSQQSQGLAAIPIGTIVSWWSSDLQLPWTGEGFQLCDGSTITDSASPLVGARTPDLRQAFVRGVVNYEQIGQTGGSATHTHGYILSQHTHPIVHSHTVDVYTTSIVGTDGLYAAGSSISQATHNHVFTTDSSTASPADTGDNPSGQSSVTSASASLPPFMFLLRAVRIK